MTSKTTQPYYGGTTFMSKEATSSVAPTESNADGEMLDQATRDLIALRAYELFQSRGAVDGADIDDWLQAEREVLQGSRPKL
jgi:hypothetical protein